MWMPLGPSLLPCISLKFRKPFGLGPKVLGGNLQLLVSRWQRRGEGAGKRQLDSQSWQEQLLELQCCCKILSSLCPRSPAIIINCLL